jgi:hypothetical protein
MKNTIVRAFVLTLVSAGLAATTVAHAKTANSTKIISSSSFSSLPVAVCPPNDPNCCGLD